MNAEYRTITVRGQDLRVAVSGPEDAERTLLLFNGIGASVETIAPFARHFRRTRLVTFDVPGVGGSPTPVAPYRFASVARMAAGILDDLGLDRVDVFGVSWGGALAQQFAHDYPERTGALVLAATSAGAIMVPGNLRVLLKMMTPKRYTDPDFMMRVGPELYGGQLRFNSELLVDHIEVMKAGNPRGYLYQLLAGYGWTSWLMLPRIGARTLVMMGEDDPIVPPVNGRILVSRLPNARLQRVDCGHLFMLTQAETIADQVEAFLHETEDADAA